MQKLTYTLLLLFTCQLTIAQSNGKLPEKFRTFYFAGVFLEDHSQLIKSNSPVAGNIKNDLEIILSKYYDLHYNNNEIDLWVSQRPDLNVKNLSSHLKNYSLDFFVYVILEEPCVVTPYNPCSQFDLNNYRLMVKVGYLKTTRLKPYRLLINKSGIRNDIYREKIIEEQLLDEVIPEKTTYEKLLTTLKQQNDSLSITTGDAQANIIAKILYAYLDLINISNNYPINLNSKQRIEASIDTLKSGYENYVNIQMGNINRLTETYFDNTKKINRSENISNRIRLFENVIKSKYDLVYFYQRLGKTDRVNTLLIMIENDTYKLEQLKKLQKNEK